MTNDVPAHNAVDEENGMAPVGTVGTAIAAAAESSVGKSLLGPTANALGQYFGRRTEAWVERREARQRKNVDGHVEHIKTIEHIALPEDPTERQAEKMDEWAEFAQNVDPDKDTELAALWQALLAEIIRDDPDADDLIVSIRQLNAADARAILDMDYGWVRHEMFDEIKIAKLVDLGLVERYKFSRDRRLALLSMASASVGFLIGLVWILSIGTGESSILLEAHRQQIGLGGLLVIMASSFFMASTMFLRYAYIRLTRLGCKLRHEGERLRKRSDRP